MLLPQRFSRYLRRNQCGPCDMGVTHLDRSNRSTPQVQSSRPAFATRRTPLTLLRLLDAQCPLCQGMGCPQCASLGLR
jgi:hypothetical protein